MGLNWSTMLKMPFCIRATTPEVQVGMLGLDNAGKTTILYQLKLCCNVHPMPTVGFNVETVRCESLLLNIWDVCGTQPSTRMLWQHYTKQQTRAIIFVLDAADLKRLPQAIEELKWLWFRPELSQAVFLIFANKQDLPEALGAEQVMLCTGLQLLRRPWAIQECCALSGEGLREGIEQLEQMLLDKLSGKSCSHRLGTMLNVYGFNKA